MDVSFILANACEYMDIKNTIILSHCNKFFNKIVIPKLYQDIVNYYDNDWEKISGQKTRL